MIDVAACVARVVLVLMHHAPVTDLLFEELVKVETHHLSLFADTQVQEGNKLQSVEENARNNKGVGSNSAYLGQLVTDLDAVAVHGAEGIVWPHAIEIVDPRLRKETSQERTDHAANAVQLEDIETFIDLNPPVKVVAQSANSTSEESNEGSKPDRNVTSCGSDANETGDSA